MKKLPYMVVTATGDGYMKRLFTSFISSKKTRNKLSNRQHHETTQAYLSNFSRRTARALLGNSERQQIAKQSALLNCYNCLLVKRRSWWKSRSCRWGSWRRDSATNRRGRSRWNWVWAHNYARRCDLRTLFRSCQKMSREMCLLFYY